MCSSVVQCGDVRCIMSGVLQCVAVYQSLTQHSSSTPMCEMSYSYVQHIPFECETCHVYMTTQFGVDLVCVLASTMVSAV